MVALRVATGAFWRRCFGGDGSGARLQDCKIRECEWLRLPIVVSEEGLEGIEDGKNAWVGIDAPSVCGTLCWQLPTGRDGNSTTAWFLSNYSHKYIHGSICRKSCFGLESWRQGAVHVVRQSLSMAGGLGPAELSVTIPAVDGCDNAIHAITPKSA